MKPYRNCYYSREEQLERERENSERLRKEIRELKKELEESKIQVKALTHYILSQETKDDWEF